MAERKPRRAKLHIAERAILDFIEIENFSIRQWGKPTASRYLSDLEAGLQRIQRNPSLLRPEPGLHPSLQFYPVNKHLFVCDVAADAIFLLTVLHGSMDIPTRLAELAQTLSNEIELLHRQLRS